MGLFVRIILWGLLLLMLKDARSESRTELRKVEANNSVASEDSPPKVRETHEKNQSLKH